MKRYQLIVFDWDGTLYDSSVFIVQCVQKAAGLADLPIPDAETVKKMIGLSFDQALKRAMPDLSPMQLAHLIKIYKQCVAESDVKPVLFSGAKTVLEQLKEDGYWLAIATGKSRTGLSRDLHELGMQDWFVTTRTADETQSKPHPQMLLEIMDELGVTSEQTLMIGDTEYDMQLAANAHTDALAVTYGVHSVEQLQAVAVAKDYLNDIRDLPAWLAK